MSDTPEPFNPTPKAVVTLFLKGIIMGISDIIPGISGGTIAFITGIYETLITSLAKLLHIERLRELLRGEIKKLYQAINGTFLITLGLGIGASIFTLAHAVEYALAEFPILIWSFFFALILSSAVLIAKKSLTLTFPVAAAFLLGLLCALLITLVLLPTTAPVTYPRLFINGLIAITAMLLPGISGSYLLLIMGSYETVITAIKTLDFPILIVFALGCSTGILLFSKILHYIIRTYYLPTLALLTGFMLGALPKAWPWKTESGTLLTPHQYTLTLGPSLVTGSLLCMLLAVFFVIMLSWADKKKAPHSTL